MAVQAQYPSNFFSPDFCGRPRSKNADEELQMLKNRAHHTGDDLIVGANTHLNNGTTMLSDPQSVLTCNAASGSRKRNRQDGPALSCHPPTQFSHPNLLIFPAKAAGIEASTVVPQLSHEHCRMYGSTGTSTSGRPAVVSPLAQDLVSLLYHQSMETDALLRVQTERLRSGLNEARKRHCRALLSVLDQQVVNCLSEKEAELEITVKRNAELEEMVRQMTAERQIWFEVADNNEAIASGLRTTLDQLLVQNTISTAVPPAIEGYGDSDDAAHSCCFEEVENKKVAAAAVGTEDGEIRRRGGCRLCRGEEEVCVLLLPCRHLCLCKACESSVDTCPVCHSTKKASLQILMS